MSELTPTMERDLLALLREWRAGRLGGRGPAGVQPTAPSPPSRFGPLYQVTAVGGGVCSVQRVDAAGSPVAATVLTGVLYDTEPAVGDNVLLARRTTGALCIFQGGGGDTAAMIKAKAAMTANDTAYNCVYLEADGTEGAALTARRPNGIPVSAGDIGFLGFDSSAQAVFIPAGPSAGYGTTSIGSRGETEAADTTSSMRFEPLTEFR
jgi:hypothetical protein